MFAVILWMAVGHFLWLYLLQHPDHRDLKLKEALQMLLLLWVVGPFVMAYAHYEWKQAHDAWKKRAET